MFYEQMHFGTSDYFKKESGENFSFPPHLHQCFELLLVKNGEMDVTVGKNRYTLQANECILIFPNQIHALSSSKSKHELLIFSPKLIQAYYTKKSGEIPTDNRFVLDHYLQSRLKALSQTASVMELKGLLYMVCSAFDKTAAYENAYSDNGLLPQIFAFVEQNYNSCCTLKSLARFLGYDYAYISRIFKETAGISYNNYVNIFRLNTAGYLLDNSEMSILDCAVECGYKSLRSFNRNFKQFYGIAPSAYRKRRMSVKKQNNVIPE